ERKTNRPVTRQHLRTLRARSMSVTGNTIAWSCSWIPAAVDVPSVNGQTLADAALVIRLSAPPRGPRPAGHPVTVGLPTGERGKRHRSRWSAPPDERPWAVALGLPGLPWADGDGMGRLPSQPPGDLDQAVASILEPDAPPEAVRVARWGCGQTRTPTRLHFLA